MDRLEGRFTTQQNAVPLYSSTMLNDKKKISTNPIIYNFKACNLNNICSFLDDLDFISNLNSIDFDSSVLKFHEMILHSFDVFVPKIQLNTNNVQNTIWSNKSLRNLIKLKKLAHKKYKLTNSNIDYDTFSDLRKKCKNLSVLAHNQLISNLKFNKSFSAWLLSETLYLY